MALVIIWINGLAYDEVFPNLAQVIICVGWEKNERSCE